MNRRVTGIAVFLILFIAQQVAADRSYPAEEKSLTAIFTEKEPSIDGQLNDDVWKGVPVASDFIQFEPYNGRAPSHKTEVRILYDNRALYVAARLFDSSPDSILTELGKRDQNDLNADYFSTDISPYGEGHSSFEFKVTASGIQIDEKYSREGSDKQWDAVWKSEVRIDSLGWTVEMEIPYSAIRFPRTEVQEWGINFWREVKRNREISTLNYIDKKVDGIINQSGLLTGIRGIKPPLRLSLEPYLSGYTEKNPETDWSFRASYGADVKLGLSESFTLDMTLIPDFGQVESDDIIIDLSPFEVYYSEKRQFFTEGTELFSRGDIFYSRRIGTTPVGLGDVYDDYDSVVKSTLETQLINASKVSGRTGKGLGVGVFNAITAPAKATVADSSGSNTEEVVIQPLTNYNMVVFDQSFRNNSFISAYNTNVYMGDFYHTANVSGTQFRLANKSNTYAVSGLYNISQKYSSDKAPEFGHKYTIKFDKISGNFLGGIWQRVETDKWDPNDMGFDRVNNVFRNGIFMRYNIYEPFWKILELYNLFSLELNYLYAPRKYTSVEIEYSLRTTFRNRLTVGFEFDANPFEIHDYYEPRVEGRVVKLPSQYDLSFFLSPDYTKKVVIDFSGGIDFGAKYKQRSYNASLGPRLRISDHMFLRMRSSFEYDMNDLGYVTDSLRPDNSEAIIFGKRDIKNITNTLNLTYTFNNKLNLELRLRHYWFVVQYNRFYDLKEDGYLRANDFTGDYDINYTAFNIDTYLTWYFAPGSEMIVAWQNAISAFQDPVTRNFFNSFDYALSSPASNSFSVKIIYYLDYQYLKKKIKKPS